MRDHRNIPPIILGAAKTPPAPLLKGGVQKTPPAPLLKGGVQKTRALPAVIPALAAWTAALILLTGGCGESEPWEGSFASLEALGEAAAQALSDGDAEALRKLRVNKEDYLDWIWREFPSSNPPQNFPADFAWSNLNKNSSLGERRWAERYQGRQWKFVEMRFEEPTDRYRRFKLLRGTALILEDETGKRYDLRILGSVVMKDGNYKLLSYKE